MVSIVLVHFSSELQEFFVLLRRDMANLHVVKRKINNK